MRGPENLQPENHGFDTRSQVALRTLQTLATTHGFPPNLSLLRFGTLAERRRGQDQATSDEYGPKSRQKAKLFGPGRAKARPGPGYIR